MYVLILATCDTKGAEAAWLAARLAELGVEARIADTGCLGESSVSVAVTREEVFAAAGTSLAALVAGNDRGHAVDAAALGVTRLVLAAQAAGELAGVLGIGGSAGTIIGTAAMRALPLGVPKLMVSTLAAGQMRSYVGGKDLLMMNAVVDIAGINRISRVILGNAAGAMAGMVQGCLPSAASEDRPLVAASMFGVTTPCVERAREVLEEAGYEVLIFHATGSGGETMEVLIREGVLAGVLDLTTTELADEYVGGVLSAGPSRLTAAAELGVPQVVSVGATDMVNFQGRETIPERFAGRVFYEHNAEVTLMRTTVPESAELGKMIGSRLSSAAASTVILLPRAGVSAIDRAGQPFDDPAARAALFTAVHESCGRVECTELEHHINDPQFAEACARRLLRLIQVAKQ